MRVQSTKATSVAAAMMAMAVTAATAHAQNLLINGDFEQFVQGDDYNIPGWQQAIPGGPAGPDELGAHYDNSFSSGEYARNTGGRSFKTYSPPAQYGGSVGVQRVAVTPGLVYNFTGYIFSPSTDFITAPDLAIAGFGFRNSAGGTVGADQEQQFKSTSPADTWVPFNFTATAPAGAAFARVVIGDIKISTTTLPGAVYYDDLSLTQVVVVSESNWIATGSGGWLSGSNWQSGIIPNAIGATANFGASATAASTVTVSGAGVTAGTVRFNNAANAYTIGGTSALTLDVASGSAALTVQAGSHAINAPLVLNDSTVASVVTGQTLTVGGALTFAAGTQLSATGVGTLRINASSVTGATGAAVVSNGGIVQADVDLGNNVDLTSTSGQIVMNASQHVRSLSVAAAGKATLSDQATARVIRTPSLTVASGGTLQLGDNYAIVDYTGTSPAAAIRTGITAGIAGGNVGTGIISSKAAADSKYAIGYVEASLVPARTTFAGETGYDNTTVLVRVTLKGDTDLSGNVNFDDLINLAQNYGGTGKNWFNGDSDYNGTVNFDDLIPLAQNYNASAANLQAAGLSDAFVADWALAQSLVPEPTTLAAAFGATSILLRRGRRAVR